ncbi:MAG: endonuclease [Pseudanabaenaceae cyanobacterium bins.39]|nr:endonuclease [Pseudanabaenaceae cyanobacterium bins.39]
MAKKTNYDQIIAEIFKRHYVEGMESFEFERQEMYEVSSLLEIEAPKNLGDLTYSYRFRRKLPKSITDTAKDGLEWVIENAGKSTYRFKLSTINRIIPNPNLITIKIPDSTPEIIQKYALGDEQALLAKVRYNRLIDIFLGITTYSLQNHLRTTVKGIGQIEIDEIYVGINSYGNHFVIPVQAKAGHDQIGIVQTRQDISCCNEKFPDLLCRSISVQFLDDNTIAMFELTLEDEYIKVVEERHYQLVKTYPTLT